MGRGHRQCRWDPLATLLDPPFFSTPRLRGLSPGPVAHATAAIRLSLGGEDVGVMSQPVQQGGGQLLIAKHLDPLAEAQVGSYQDYLLDRVR